MPFGSFSYSCQDELICKAEIENVPYFNAPIYLENKEQIGKVDEIFGNIKEYSISIKLGESMKAGSFKPQQKVRSVYITVRTVLITTLFSCSSIPTNCCPLRGFYLTLLGKGDAASQSLVAEEGEVVAVVEEVLEVNIIGFVLRFYKNIDICYHI